MRSFELVPTPVAETVYLDSALGRHPPLPVGSRDISDIVELAKNVPSSAPGYAWERLPSWIAEIKGVYEYIGGIPIIGLDICSSTAWSISSTRKLRIVKVAGVWSVPLG